MEASYETYIGDKKTFESITSTLDINFLSIKIKPTFIPEDHPVYSSTIFYHILSEILIDDKLYNVEEIWELIPDVSEITDRSKYGFIVDLFKSEDFDMTLGDEESSLWKENADIWKGNARLLKEILSIPMYEELRTLFYRSIVHYE